MCIRDSNSVATIFTMDLYSYYKPDKSQKQLVTVGRIVGVTALVTAALCAKPLLGKFDQAFQYIQEFTGFFTPGICVLFVAGMFWGRATANGALLAAVGSAAFSLALKLLWPSLPFIDRVGLVFLACLAVIIVVSLMERSERHPKAVDLAEVDFKTSTSFNVSGIAVALILIALYATWW